MKLSFTTEQFLENFSNYNLSVFPAQVAFYLLALAALYFTFKSTSHSAKIISAVLSFFWLWMGIVYHLLFFTAINKAAYIFGSVFILQGLLLMIFGVFLNKLSFKFRFDTYGVTGLILVLFALIVYPVLGYFLGHSYPSSPTFGLPCPTTIFTFGLLLMSDRKYPVLIFIIPVLWSIVGFMAALNFGIWEDTGLLVAGILTFTLLLIRNRKYRQAT